MIRQYTYRFEIKFLIDWITYVTIRSQIRPFVKLDKYAPPSGRYSLLSLYYDSPNYDCYYDKIDGHERRYKFRIRWYLDENGVRKAAFLELKKKVNYGTFKKRLMINNNAIGDFLRNQGDFVKRICRDSRQDDIAEEMLFYYSAQRLQPAVYTHYFREAYVGKCENRLRITFDIKTSCKPGRGKDFDFASKRYIFNPYYMVLEIKGFHDMPHWLTAIISSNNLQKQNISKYCLAVDAARLLI